MAADLASLQVNISGAGAQSSADSIRVSLENMGAAGDTAAAKVESAGTRAAAGLRPAADAAQSTGSAYQTMFERISSAGTGTGTGGLANLVAEASRAQTAFEALQKFATEMAQTGDAGSAGMSRMADKSLQAANAIQAIITQMGTMVSAGNDVSDVISTMTDKLAKVGAATNFTGKLQAEFSGLREEFASLADVETTVAERANIARTVIGQFGVATQAASVEAVGGLEQVDKQVTVVRSHMEALRQMQSSPLGTSANFLTNLTMGIQQLGSGSAMGSLMGIQQLGMAATEGSIAIDALGASFVLLVPILAGAVVSFEAVKAAVDLVKDGMKGAAEDETFEIRMKNVMGTTQAATDTISRLVALSTTGSLSFIKTDDLKNGTLILEQFTGGVMATEDALKKIGGASVESGKGFTEISEQIGKMYANIAIGAPVRVQLLQSLAGESVIAESDVTAIKNMQTAHASATEILKRFQQAIESGSIAADQAKGSWAGLMTGLSNIVNEDFAQPLGAALEGALKPFTAELNATLGGQSGAVQAFADNLEVQLLTVFKFIQLESINKGIGGALMDVATTFGSQMLDSINKVIPQVITSISTALENALTAGIKGIKIDWDHELGLPSGTISNFQKATSIKDTGTPLNANPTGATPVDTLKVLTDGAQNIIKDVSDSFLHPAQFIQDQDKANSQKQGDAAQKQIDAANLMAQAAQQVLHGLAGIQQGAQSGFNMADRTTQTGPFPGAVRTMAYGPVMGEYGGAQMYGATGPGRGTPLQDNDVAMSVSLMAQMGLHLKDFVDILDQSGKVLLAHQHIMDTSWKTDASGNKIDTGGIETRARQLQDWTVVRPSMGQNTGAAPSTASTMDQAHAWALQQVKPPTVPDTAPKNNVNDEELIKKNTDDLKAYEALIKQITTDQSVYGTQMKTVQEQIKDGQISITQGQQKEIDLTKTEMSTLTQQIGTLQQIQAAAQKAHDPALVEKSTDELKKLEAELQKYQVDLQKLQGGDFWGSFISGIQQAENAWGNLSTQAQTAGKDMTAALASGLTTGLGGLIDGTKSASAAFADMAKSIIASIEQIILKLLIEQAIQAATSALHLGGGGAVPGGNVGYNAQYAGGGTVGFPTGGVVTGGTQGTDSVAAMLTPGEYVLTTKMVDSIGTRALDDWRQGVQYAHGGMVGFGQRVGFAEGGLVGYAAGGKVENPAPQTAASGASNSGHTFNTQVTVPGGGDNSMSPQEAKQFQDSITQAIRFEISRQKKPGGLLNRNSGAG